MPKLKRRFVKPETKLEEIKKDFFDTLMAWRPVYATSLGFFKYDHLLRIESDQERSEERGFWIKLLSDLEPYLRTWDSLSDDDQMDVEVMRKAALWGLLQIDSPLPLGWKNSADISDLIDTVYHNISFEPKRKIQWQAILSRMNSIPSVLEQKEKNLRIGLEEELPFYSREVQFEALEIKDEIGRYFREDVPQAARRLLPKAVFSEMETPLIQSSQRIRAALDHYVYFLQKEIQPVAKENSFMTGDREYQRRLNLLILTEESTEALFGYGKKVVNETEKAMSLLARKIQKKKNWKEKNLRGVISHLQKETAPQTDSEMFKMYNRLVDRTVSFVVSNRLFKLPPKYSIDIKPTPKAFRSVLSMAAMLPIPPFADGKRAEFWVTPTETAGHPTGEPETLAQNHCEASAPNLVVHEAVPGHDLQTGESARRFIKSGRKDHSFKVRQFTPDVMWCMGVEGWAHYTEQLMAEEDFYSNEERLFQLLDAQMRNARIVVDIGIHTGRMTYAEAIDYFELKTVSSRSVAEKEIYRYSKWPLQAITYHFGKRDILDLREKVKKAVGVRKFDLKKFHELVLDYEGLPVSLFERNLIRRAEKLMK